MDNEITEVIQALIERHGGSLDMAERDFRRLLDEDPSLHRQYKEWCAETGYSERRGFVEYGHSYMEEESSMWDIFEEE